MSSPMKRGLILALGAVLVAASLAGAAPTYVGAKKCKMCHLKQYKSWEATKMAQSFELLKPGVRAEEKKAAGLDADSDYTADAECLACHTTGYGKPGGFVSLAETPDLVGVQCEMCHGPGSDYLADDKMSLKNQEYKLADLTAVGLVVPDAGTCLGNCHNDKSPFFTEDFDYETRKKEGTHEHIPLKYSH